MIRLLLYIGIGALLAVMAVMKMNEIDKNADVKISNVWLEKEKHGVPVDTAVVAKGQLRIYEKLAVVYEGKKIMRADITPESRKNIRTGQVFGVTTENGQKIVGSVKYVSSSRTLGTGLYPATLEIKSGGKNLQKGSILVAFIRVKTVKNAITVPGRSIHEEKSSKFAWVISNGVATKRAVKTGKSNSELVQIISGLAPDEKVIVRGASELSEGIKVRIHKNQEGA